MQIPRLGDDVWFVAEMWLNGRLAGHEAHRGTVVAFDHESGKLAIWAAESKMVFLASYQVGSKEWAQGQCKIRDTK